MLRTEKFDCILGELVSFMIRFVLVFHDETFGVSEEILLIVGLFDMQMNVERGGGICCVSLLI